MIVAHVGGLPVEETIPQLAPAWRGDRRCRPARARTGAIGARSLRSRGGDGSSALVALRRRAGGACLVDGCSAAGPAVTAPRRSLRSFSDGCRDFTSRATKVGSSRARTSRTSSSTTPTAASSRTSGSAAPTTRSTAPPAARSTSRSSSRARRRRGSRVQESSPPTALLEVKTPPVGQTWPAAAPSGQADCPANSRLARPTGRAQPRFPTRRPDVRTRPLGLRSFRRPLLAVLVHHQLPRHEQHRSRQRHRELVDRLRRRDVGERELEHESAGTSRPRLYPSPTVWASARSRSQASAPSR